MPLFKKGEQVFYFCHIPKTGGASIEYFFRKYYMISMFSTNLHRGSIPFNCSPQHFHAEVFDELIHSELYDFSFCIVRDPIARFISEYRYRMRERISLGKEKLTIEEFFNNVTYEYSKNNYIYDNHIRPQCEFISKDMKVYFYEDGLENILKSLFSEFNINLEVGSLAHANKHSSDTIDVPIIDNALESRIKSFYSSDYNYFNWG